MDQVWLAAAIFLLTYAVIVSERIHRTVAALTGGVLTVLSGVLSQEEAFHAIDLNVIFLLAGMMMIATIMAETGIFQWLAVKAVHWSKGEPMTILSILAVVTAISSALLDNVTVVVLIAPVTLFLASNLEVSPVPFLITSVMASNIGGAATLIGDPPNILIASAARIDFLTFLVNMSPPVIVSLLLYLIVIRFQFDRQLQVSDDRKGEARQLETRRLITKPKLLRQSMITLGLVLVTFLFHSALHLEPATIALGGATLLLIVTRKDPHEVLQNVEWTTLFFFVGLFITVEAVVKVGLIDQVAQRLLELTKGDLRVTAYVVVWLSAIASGIVDNIPYTATMLPLIQSLGSSIQDITPLWWALALGADFGGNLTLVGASANIVAANLAERSGHELNFWVFIKYGVLTTLITLVVATLWLELFYV